eukprot:Rhum_TRINITY_DN11368_c0_g1::Rhum_TRINITY_DN11368_c0_g1_i1::g.44158::m.44158
MENNFLSRLAIIISVFILYRMYRQRGDIDTTHRPALMLTLVANAHGTYEPAVRTGRPTEVLVLVGNILPPEAPAPGGRGNGTSSSSSSTDASLGLPRPRSLESFAREKKKLDAFLERQRRKYRHRIVVWGGQDVPPSLAASGESLGLEHAEVLHDAYYTVDGIVFYGTSWQPQSEAEAFYLPRGSAALHAKRAGFNDTERKVSVVLSYAPPLGGAWDAGELHKTEQGQQELQNLVDAEVAGALQEESSSSSLDASDSGSALQQRRGLESHLLAHEGVHGAGAGASVSARWGCGLLTSSLRNVHPRLVVSPALRGGYGKTLLFGINHVSPTVFVPPSAAANAAGATRDAQSTAKRRKPLIWRLIRPDTYPKVNNQEVPFVIE